MRTTSSGHENESDLPGDDGLPVLQKVDRQRIQELRDRGQSFWLDLTDPTDGDLTTLSELVNIHPLALEDSREFGQRVKYDRYADSALVVIYGAEPGQQTGWPQLVEVHLHLSDNAMVTVSRRQSQALARARRDAGGSSQQHSWPIYRVVDSPPIVWLDPWMHSISRSIFCRMR